jgi:hypothetical protein
MRAANDIRWLAGLLEGEGAFGLNGGHAQSARIVVSMTDEDVVARAAGLLGSRLRSLQPRQLTKAGGPRKRVYTAAVYGSQAAGWMMTLWPLMGQRRRAEIGRALAVWRAQRPKNPQGAGRRNPRCRSETASRRATEATT